MNSITINLPLPPTELSANSRTHWAAKAKAVKAYRALAWAAGRAAQTGQPKRWVKASVKVKAFYRSHNHPDPDNVIASLKAAFDGIADAGVVVNDRGLWPERPEISKDAKNPRIELTITEEP